MVFKVEVATIAVALLAGWALWIERGHHILIDVPAPADPAALAAAAGCPDNDTLPYTASCLAFLQRTEDAGAARAAPNP